MFVSTNIIVYVCVLAGHTPQDNIIFLWEVQ